MTRAELPERIETERLVLRVRSVPDVVDIFDYASRPEVSYPAGFRPSRPWKMRFIIWSIFCPSAMKRTISQLVTAQWLKGTDTIIGSVDFPRRHEDDVLEIGYILHPDYWGRGYVPEAARNLD